jgi:hypothetical protein
MRALPSRVTGTPERTASAHASVTQAAPPSPGVVASTASPARAAVSMVRTRCMGSLCAPPSSSTGRSCGRCCAVDAAAVFVPEPRGLRASSSAVSTADCACCQGAPVSQTSSSANSVRYSARASTAAPTRVRRSCGVSSLHARCCSCAASTAARTSASVGDGAAATALPSTGLMPKRTSPPPCPSPRTSCHVPSRSTRRPPSSVKASGAAARQRRQAWAQEVPGLRRRGVGPVGVGGGRDEAEGGEGGEGVVPIVLLRSRCTYGAGR